MGKKDGRKAEEVFCWGGMERWVEFDVAETGEGASARTRWGREAKYSSKRPKKASCLCVRDMRWYEMG